MATLILREAIITYSVFFAAIQQLLPAEKSKSIPDRTPYVDYCMTASTHLGTKHFLINCPNVTNDQDWTYLSLSMYRTMMSGKHQNRDFTVLGFLIVESFYPQNENPQIAQANENIYCG